MTQKHIGGWQSEGRGLFVACPQERLQPPTERELLQWPLVADVYPDQVRSREQRIAAARVRPMTLVHQAPLGCKNDVACVVFRTQIVNIQTQ